MSSKWDEIVFLIDGKEILSMPTHNKLFLRFQKTVWRYEEETIETSENFDVIELDNVVESLRKQERKLQAKESDIRKELEREYYTKFQAIVEENNKLKEEIRVLTKYKGNL
jgi:hypothetical protein